MSDATTTETTPLIADAFGEFWEKHPIHQSGLDDEALAKFREFAANIWNNARFDMGLKHLAAMDRLHSIGLNPDMHPTLEATVEGVLRMVTNLRKDLAKAGSNVLPTLAPNDQANQNVSDTERPS